MELELYLYKYCYKLTINNSQFKEIVRPMLAPQNAIDLFHRHFEELFVYTCRCSPTMEAFLALDDLIHKEEKIRKRKRSEAFLEGRHIFYIL